MKNSFKEMFKAELFTYSVMFKSDRHKSVIFVLITSIIQLMPLLSVWLWKLIIDQFTFIYTNGLLNNSIYILLGIYLSITVITSILTNINTTISGILGSKCTQTLDKQIMNKIATIDTEFYDNPENRDINYIADQSRQVISQGITWMLDTVICIITFISGISMFLSYNIWFGIIFICTYIPGSYISFKNEKKMDEFSIYEVPLNRKKNYYKSLLTQSFAAKDLRLYNLTGRYKEIYNGLWSGIRKERTKIFEENTISSFLASLFSYAGIVSIIIFSVHLVMNGTMSIGTFALYIGLSQAIGEKFKYIFVCIMCQKEITAPRIIRLINFLNYENKIKDNGKKEITNLSAIEFKNVFFKYPNCQNYVLKGFNLRIAKGKKIALIGINGAGKSTIVKLLLRFYEPESGQIMINGEDIHQYSLDELHKIFAVCFQDINTYSLTFKENIALSDIDRIDNIEDIKKAARASGADKILNNLPLGLDTDMTRNFNNEGVELSGGQWQKVALARAFFKKSDFIILDEPTASLDPEAEDYLFRSFKWLCRDKGGILISHRLSSIMLVDEIILIGEGAVIEKGTHAELMEKNGKYAELYRIQANKYMEGDADV